MSITKITECRECGSKSLTWQTHNKNVGQAQQGRLNSQDIQCQLVLGCDVCSETLAIVSADNVATWLTEQGQASLSPNSDAPVAIDEMVEFEKWWHSVKRPVKSPIATAMDGWSAHAALSAHTAATPPVVRVSAVALREAMDNLAIKASVADLPPFFLPAAVRQVPIVMLGDVCVRVSYSGLKWYHDQLINDRWEPLAVEEFDALLTEALAKA